MIIDDLLHKIEMQNQKIGDMDKEIGRLHKVFDIKDEARAELVKENKSLRKNIEYLCNENVRLRHDLNEVRNNDRNY